jgi:ADP-heptose:LPS heptosyltransferase
MRDQPPGRNLSEDPVVRSPVVSPTRILVFRIGQLGDTIVALPAMWAVKHNFPAAYLALLYDRHPRKRYVFASDLLRGAGLFDEFLTYPVAAGDAFKAWRMTSLLLTLRRKRFDTLVYLAPSTRSPEQVARDRRFFSLAGIRTSFGMDGFAVRPSRANGQPLAESLAESDLLLDRVGASGLVFSRADRARMDLALGKTEDLEVDSWLQGLEPFDARPWVAVAPGSKMPAKRWPLERYAEAVQRLIEKFDVWPIVLGGAEDRPQGDTLRAKWRRGYNAAGRLSLRASAAALKRCAFYLGNDTGTMHLAAAVGTKCVAIFSARDRPGRWNPSGDGHRVLRSQIDCEGCDLVECLERHNECLARISVPTVTAACEALLAPEHLAQLYGR